MSVGGGGRSHSSLTATDITSLVQSLAPPDKAEKDLSMNPKELLLLHSGDVTELDGLVV